MKKLIKIILLLAAVVCLITLAYAQAPTDRSADDQAGKPAE
jgi:hypothetical protein